MTVREPLGSVVIPAYDEAGAIQGTLDALFEGSEPGELEVVVVCNGCSDDTAVVARASGHRVRVLELQRAYKPAALRRGDAEARAFPRLYLDADVLLPGSAARLVLERLRSGALAARPPIRYAVSGASAPVRRYYRARSRVPAVLGSLWGAGVYGLSAAGRSRFGAFPDVVADDLWVDRLFSDEEMEIVDCEPVVVQVPRRSRDLVRVLVPRLSGQAREDGRAGSARPGPGDRDVHSERPGARWPRRPRRRARRRDVRHLCDRGAPRAGAASSERAPDCGRPVGARRELEGELTCRQSSLIPAEPSTWFGRARRARGRCSCCRCSRSRCS